MFLSHASLLAPLTEAAKSSASDSANLSIGGVDPGEGTSVPNPSDRSKDDDPNAEKEAEENPIFEVGADTGLKFKWDDGLFGETEDKAFKFHIGGRVHYDSAWYSVPGFVQDRLGRPDAFEDGSAYRRLRIRTDGTFWEQIDFMVELDFAAGQDFRSLRDDPRALVGIFDAWLNFSVPVVENVRVGHQKEYLTFVNATSSRYILFIERPAIFDAFENDIQFDDGVAAFRTYLDDRMTTWLGFFRTGTRSAGFGVGDGDYAVSGRWTVLPVYDDTQQTWVNVGVSGTARAMPDNEERARVRAPIRGGTSFQAPTLADTGTFFSRDGIQVAAAGVHGACGPFYLGGEYMIQHTNDSFTGGLPVNGILPTGVAPAGDIFFQGWYVEGTYFLTRGDHHGISRTIPSLARVKPVEPFFLVRDGDGRMRKGTGAWEAGLRFDHIDLNSGTITGGVLDTVTVGLNWYMTSNARVMFNYAYVWRRPDVTAPGTFIHGLGTRVAFDF